SPRRPCELPAGLQARSTSHRASCRCHRPRLAPPIRRRHPARMTDANTGRFVWYELLTTDVNAAIAFYTDVVRWKTQAWETGNYTMWVGSQGPLGGVTQLPEPAKKMGAPPHWQANVQVANVDQTVEQVSSSAAR